MIFRSTQGRRLSSPVTVSQVGAGLLVAWLAIFHASGSAATEVKVFRAQSQSAFLAGTPSGISVDPLGRLQLADRAERLTSVDEPFLFSAATHPEGWVVGTGSSGRVLLIDRQGEVRELFQAPEPQIFAVWADDDGTVFAGASPGGKIYRIPAQGDAGMIYETGETYVWALARSGDRLLAATGTSGKLFEIDLPVGASAAAGAVQGRVFFDSEDTHLRSLKVLDDGSAVVGTAGEGLVLHVRGADDVRTLYDAAQPEIIALTVDDMGRVIVAAIASEASQVDLTATTSKPSEGQGEGGSGGNGAAQATVTVTEGAIAAGSRPASFRGARSQIIAVTLSGQVDSLWSFDDETVFSVLSQQGRLWVGTGLEGNLYAWNGEQMVLEKDLDERQIVEMMADTDGPAFVTTNAPALYRMTGAKERAGTYTSAALDAGSIARFGTFHWRGAVPKGAQVTFSFRSGNSAEPDATWSSWTAAPGGAVSGRMTGEVPLIGVPRGRYLQWRGQLSGSNGRSPRLDGVEVSYRQDNLQPTIQSFATLSPGQILVPTGFNPSTQVYEPASPNKDGIFTALEARPPKADARLKTLWKKGFRTFQWEAEDPNGDSLVSALEFRRADDEAWLPVAKDLEQSHYSFDSTVLPDGVYRFRVVVSDAEANSPNDGRSAERLSEPVVIDHTPARVSKVSRSGDVLKLAVIDDLNPLRSAEVSSDAKQWHPATTSDGLVDARREILEVSVGDTQRLLLLRLTDGAYNVTTIDLSEHLR